MEGVRELAYTSDGMKNGESETGKFKFLSVLQTHKLWFTLSCTKKITPFCNFPPSHLPSSSECCFPLQAAVQAWAGDCGAVTRTGQFVSNLTPAYWLPHTQRLETTCGVTSPSECHVSVVVHLPPRRAIGNTMFSLLWVHWQDGISAPSAHIWWKFREQYKGFTSQTREW